MRWISHRVLSLLGWKFEGSFPDVPKMVVIGAPHTSNWDFFLYQAVLHHFDIRTHFLGKHTLFRGPFGWIFERMGGIPVNRARAGGVVRQVKDQFDTHDQMILVIAPEGTRRRAGRWKSGFLEIAQGAGVPIVLAGVDYPTKTVTIGPLIDSFAPRAEVMGEIRAFYEGKTGLKPEGQGPVRVARET